MRTDTEFNTMALADKLEGLYTTLNRRCYVHPDPLEFLYPCRRTADREIVALIASSLAYGRVNQILISVARVLDILGSHPASTLAQTTPAKLKKQLKDFRHRFSTGTEVAQMLLGARKLTGEFGSLGNCFAAGLTAEDETITPALKQFVDKLRKASGQCGHLIPDPDAKSAMKRMNLMLRWMIRKDSVDPGGWSFAEPAKLIYPLDTHMHTIGTLLGATTRKTADMKTAMEITSCFRKINPADPVKYDFALTRLGIRDEMDLQKSIRKLKSR